MASLLEILAQIKKGGRLPKPEPIVKYTVQEIRSRRTSKIADIKQNKNPKGGGK
jgi:hypothetical protein